MVAPPVPPHPFGALDEIVSDGSPLYRIHSFRFRAAQFNPGIGSPTRFAFFGTPVIPTLYAGDTEDAAFCETILHDVPLRGGIIYPAQYAGRQCSRLIVRRDLRLASLVGLGPRSLGVRAADVCGTDAKHYGDTVRWAEAAHGAGFDGIAYPSKQASGRRATVYFGDRVSESDFEPDVSYRWYMDDTDGFSKMYDLCSRIQVRVLRA